MKTLFMAIALSLLIVSSNEAQDVPTTATLRSGTTCTLKKGAPIPQTVTWQQVRGEKSITTATTASPDDAREQKEVALDNLVTLDNLTCKGSAGGNLYQIDGTGPEGFGVKGTRFGSGSSNKRFGNAWNNSFTAQLTPGPHILTMAYFGVRQRGLSAWSWEAEGSEPVKLTFAAEPGHTYTINAVVWEQFRKESWLPVVFDITDRAHTRMVPNQSVTKF